MSTRGQHGQDTIQRMIQETEEQKKYELEQQNNTYLNKAIKSLPISDINKVNFTGKYFRRDISLRKNKF